MEQGRFARYLFLIVAVVAVVGLLNSGFLDTMTGFAAKKASPECKAAYRPYAPLVKLGCAKDQKKAGCEQFEAVKSSYYTTCGLKMPKTKPKGNECNTAVKAYRSLIKTCGKNPKKAGCEGFAAARAKYYTACGIKPLAAAQMAAPAPIAKKEEAKKEVKVKQEEKEQKPEEKKETPPAAEAAGPVGPGCTETDGGNISGIAGTITYLNETTRQQETRGDSTCSDIKNTIYELFCDDHRTGRSGGWLNTSINQCRPGTCNTFNQNNPYSGSCTDPNQPINQQATSPTAAPAGEAQAAPPAAPQPPEPEQQPPAAAGKFAACSRTEDCSAGLICVENTCRSEIDFAGRDGQSCRRDGTCNAGLSCQNSICRPAPAAPAPQQPTECANDGACNARQVCARIGGIVKCDEDAKRLPGEQCKIDQNCNSSRVTTCQNSVCTTEPSGQIGGPCRERWTVENQYEYYCDNGLACVFVDDKYNTACEQPQPGQAMTVVWPPPVAVAAQVPAAAIEVQIQAAPVKILAENDKCPQEGAECPAGLTCRRMLSGGRSPGGFYGDKKCLQPRADGGKCEANDDCASKKCEDGKCAAAQPAGKKKAGEGCTKPDDCGKGLDCKKNFFPPPANICTPPPKQPAKAAKATGKLIAVNESEGTGLSIGTLLTLVLVAAAALFAYRERQE